MNRADLIIVAHGERGGAANNKALEYLASNVAAAVDYASVAGAVLKGSPSLEGRVQRTAGGDLHIYPLFMSDGYYVQQAIPERLRLREDGRDPQGRRVHIYRPFGLEPRLGDLIARRAEQALLAIDAEPGASTLLLVGHGSTKSEDSMLATEFQRSHVAKLGRFRGVVTAYLENEPLLGPALAALPPCPAVVVGLFSGEGQHAATDVPDALRRAGRDDLVYAGPIATAPEAADLIATILRGDRDGNG